MSKTVLSEVTRFTPLIDSITQEHGVITAAVFGRIWRYCQGERGVCQASLERIGADLGIDRATVLRHATRLCELGYLEDTTPDLRNRPHTYRDTGQASIVINITVAQNNSGVAENNSGVAQNNTGVAESYLKKQVKKQEKKEEAEELAFGLTPAGQVLERELTSAYEAKGRRPPTKYKTPQMRDAYQSAAAALGKEYEPLLKKGLARDRLALDRLLGWLEACVANRKADGAVRVTNWPGVPATTQETHGRGPWASRPSSSR